VAETERPKSPWHLRLTAIVVLVLFGWLLFGSRLSIFRALLGLVGYVIVAFVAFQIGKFVGRHEHTQ